MHIRAYLLKFFILIRKLYQIFIFPCYILQNDMMKKNIKKSLKIVSKFYIMSHKWGAQIDGLRVDLISLDLEPDLDNANVGK